MILRTGLAAGLLLAASLAAPTARGDTPKPVVVDRVIAVVGPRPLLLSELRARAAPFLGQIDKANLSPEARAKAERDLATEIVESMVDAELVAQAAARAHVEAPADEIEAALVNIAKQNQMSVPALLEEARKQGLTEAFYREEIGRQLREAKMLRTRPFPRGVKLAELDDHRRMEVIEKMRKDWLAELRRAAHVEIRQGSW
jgi:peptidyl-prolyl cis-trans isomerase SurA